MKQRRAVFLPGKHGQARRPPRLICRVGRASGLTKNQEETENVL